MIFLLLSVTLATVYTHGLVSHWQTSNQSETQGLKCIPKTLYEYPWKNINNNVWYLGILVPNTWNQIVDLCSRIEYGRSTIATIRTETELKNLQLNMQSRGHWWIGGIRLALPIWYWLKYKGKQESLEPIRQFFWRQDEPNQVVRIKKCLVFLGREGWSDRFCWIRFRGLCEIRC